MAWEQMLACLLATDFFTTEVWTAFGLVTYYTLFFIHVSSRKVYIAGITRNPTDA
jgi:putative transposase